MNICIVHGTLRRRNTFRVTEVIKQRLQDKGAVIAEIWLHEVDLTSCSSCYRCFLAGEEFCPSAAGVAAVQDAIAAADGVIVTSPCFSLHVPGHVKTWIDLMSFRFHRPAFFGKRGLVVATTVGQGATAVCRYLADVLGHWGFNRVHKLAVACRSLDYQPAPKDEARFRRTADRFWDELNRKQLRRPGWKRLLYFNVWRAMALAGQADLNRDYRYWDETGLLRQPFAAEVPLHPLQRLLAGGVFGLVRRLLQRA